MAHQFKDRIKEVTTTTGIGAVTLSGPVTGCLAFSSIMAVGDTCYYCIDNDAGAWEIGLGTYSAASTLTRTTVQASSNAGSLVDLPTGSKNVFIINPAANIPLLQSGTFTPVVAGNTAAGVGTYTTQTGNYQRVGNMVYFDLQLTWTAHTGTGTTQITGLPFNAAAKMVIPVALDSFTYTAQLTATTTLGQAYADLQYFSSGGALTGVTIDAAASLYMSGCYRITG